ncbi:sigma-54-dependent Fis family transcriptional regulator [uncultured Roseobacter sp.]|uniref:sigma-54 interaction domain-containing protein n=1 Tax=uncultured Roseobacter sp. TaxID=114847 RepID=UPI00260FB45F|nr:sigma-54 dependent transcriptional regulator [uncultured Roseobacter sp.]
MDALAAIQGESSWADTLRTYLPKVARSQAPVLITGETGTGKERIAQAVHDLSPRNKHRFVAINCAALPEGLIETELFGHERGAFTGAVTRYDGRAAQADGGTLFLDEIGEMSLTGQAKLLRFLEAGKIDRIGATQETTVDVRFVAATNQSLEELVAAHRFRADLYYRLNVARIEVEPLRARPDDIGVLAEGFIHELNRRDGCAVAGPDRQLARLFEGYAWPGNVRELRNMIEAVFIDPPEGEITIADLPPAFQTLISGHRTVLSTEKDDLIEALNRTKWNKAEAARLLNMSRMSVYRKIEKYRIARSPLAPR